MSDLEKNLQAFVERDFNRHYPDKIKLAEAGLDMIVRENCHKWGAESLIPIILELAGALESLRGMKMSPGAERVRDKALTKIKGGE